MAGKSRRIQRRAHEPRLVTPSNGNDRLHLCMHSAGELDEISNVCFYQCCTYGSRILFVNQFGFQKLLSNALIKKFFVMIVVADFSPILETPIVTVSILNPI